jgi:hypothetical protein
LLPCADDIHAKQASLYSASAHDKDRVRNATAAFYHTSDVNNPETPCTSACIYIIISR